MSATRNITPAFAAAFAAACLGAPNVARAAQEFSVSGITVRTAEDGWEIRAADAPPGRIGHGGIDGTLPSEGRLLIRRGDDGSVKAALLVTAQRGARGSVTITGTCPEQSPDSSFYQVRIGHPDGGPRTCAAVAGPMGPDWVLQALPVFKAAHGKSPFEMPATGFFVWGYTVDQTAALFGIEGFVSWDFVGLKDRKPTGSVGEAVEPAVAAWGDAMAATLQKALSGVFSRSTTLPPVRFAPSDAPR